MGIKICTVGGYNEVGKNMTALKVDDEVIIFDMGIHLENYISLTENEEKINFSSEELIEVDAVPNDTVIESWKKNVKAIIPSHAHLDHIGAIPHMANKYDCPIIVTPFAKAVLKSIIRDNKLKFNNKIIELKPNKKIHISKDILIEFINTTHSTPQTVMIAAHTKYGTVLYANDFKFDLYPVLGEKPNFDRLKQLKVHTLIVDSTYANLRKKMPSESVAREMLKDVMLGTDSTGKLVIVTTFSSHLARLKSIIEYGNKMNRKIVMLGRSLSKYIEAGIETNLFSLPKNVEIVKYSSKIKKFLGKIKDRNKYLLVVTGHQGEQKATLSKIVRGEMGFNINPGDHVIFSCTVIPTQTNIKNREDIEETLIKKHVRLFKDIHVSGHAAREDLRDLIEMVKPKNIIPAHGTLEMRTALKDLTDEMGIKNVFIMNNGDFIELN